MKVVSKNVFNSLKLAATIRPISIYLPNLALTGSKKLLDFPKLCIYNSNCTAQLQALFLLDEPTMLNIARSIVNVIESDTLKNPLLHFLPFLLVLLY